MRFILLTALFLCFIIGCKENSKKPGLKIVDPAVGLTMTVPGSFPRLDQETKKETFQKGKRAIDKLHDSVFVLSDIQKVNLFSHDDNNMFILNTQDYDFKTQGDFRSAIHEVNKLVYETQIKNYPASKIDSASSKEIIDGVEFIKFVLNAKVNDDITMHMVNYSKLFKNNKDFTAAVVFTDEELGKEILKAFKAATFKK